MIHLLIIHPNCTAFLIVMVALGIHNFLTSLGDRGK